MKTLNEVLTDNCIQYKEIKSCQECRYWEECKGKEVNKLIILAVNDWLMQNRSDIGNQLYSDHRVVAEAVFDVLLEKLTISEKEASK